MGQVDANRHRQMEKIGKVGNIRLTTDALVLFQRHGVFERYVKRGFFVRAEARVEAKKDVIAEEAGVQAEEHGRVKDGEEARTKEEKGKEEGEEEANAADEARDEA